MSVSSSDAVPKKDPRAGVIFNIPNQLTTLRLILSIVLFCFLAYDQPAVGLVLFIIAAGTDWMDGYYARKYGQVTTLGRILDPFVDKVIICGTFIFLAAEPGSHVVAWMVVVVVGRELLVTALRGFLEGEGADFSANLSGKLKMVFQCAAAGLSLYVLTYEDQSAAPEWLIWSLDISVWGAVLLTIYSGVVYIIAAAKLIRAMR